MRVTKNVAHFFVTGESSSIELSSLCESSGSSEFTLYHEDIARVISSAKKFAVKVGKSSVEILTGPSKFKMNKLSHTKHSPIKDFASHHIVNAQEFGEMITVAKIIPSLKIMRGSIPSDSIRFQLLEQDVYVWCCSEHLMYRGRMDSHPQGPSNKKNSFLVRAELLAPLMNFIESDTDEVSMWSDENSAYFWTKGLKIKIAQTAAKFPSSTANSIMENEENFSSSFYANRNDYLYAVRDAMIFAGETRNLDSFTSKKAISMETACESASTVSKVAIQSKGELLDFTVNGNYLRRVLSATSGKSVLVKIVDSNSPIYFTDGNSKFALMVCGEPSESSKKL